MRKRITIQADKNFSWVRTAFNGHRLKKMALNSPDKFIGAVEGHLVQSVYIKGRTDPTEY